jgi:hypothetical protein
MEIRQSRSRCRSASIGRGVVAHRLSHYWPYHPLQSCVERNGFWDTTRRSKPHTLASAFIVISLRLKHRFHPRTPDLRAYTTHRQFELEGQPDPLLGGLIYAGSLRVP